MSVDFVIGSMFEVRLYYRKEENMTICIHCGVESTECLCESCKQTVNIEEICNKLEIYQPRIGQNILWDTISSQLCNPNNFKNIIFATTDNLPTPRKEYRRILCMVGDASYIAKNSRSWLYEMYEICKSQEGLSLMELNRVKGLVMDALYKDYRFLEAEELAVEVMQSEQLPKQVYLTLAEFYTKTRRYEEAEELLIEVQKLFPTEENSMKKLMEENAKQREKAEIGKQEYMPNPKEHREEVRRKYVDFLATLGIEAEVPKGKESHIPKPIPKDQYPNPMETREANFDSFVAFDLETTGRSSKIDSIIEFGAVKVVHGQVVDSAQFTFQEFVKPFKRKFSKEVQELTGITLEDVKDARELWEVMPDFLDFVGDNVLVGFNCMAFDSKFMTRAGRYSNRIIQNKYFDVRRYALSFKERLGIENKCSLEEVTNKLSIENPRAHRALADALTTAQVYLKLKEWNKEVIEDSMDDLLADIDNW